MRRRPALSAAVLFPVFLAAHSQVPVRAAPSPAPAPATAAAAPATSSLELIVLEAPGCIYCDIFRADVKPAYDSSPRGRSVPLRFLDLNDEAADKLDLNEPVSIVPTVVVMKDRKEVGRIPGYVGPENFFKTINALLLGVE